MFRHFVITRFNVKIQDFSNVDKNNQPVLTDEWLENRFILFEKYCYQSMLNQTNQDFIWFVLFASDTPDRFLREIKKYENDFPAFKPIFLDSGDYTSIKKFFNEELINYTAPDVQYIITTRIDNDDAFHKDMISEIQMQFREEEDVFVSFTYGLQIDLRKRVLARMEYRNNHFISRIEKMGKQVQTVLTHNHAFVDRISRVIYIKNMKKPMWLEIIHDNNILNCLDTTSTPLFSFSKVRAFPLEIRISTRNTLYATWKYIRLQLLLARAAILKKLRIYEFLKGAQKQ